MKFRLYREYGALNSREIFDSCEQGLRKLGYQIVSNDEDVSVIWSVLWNGRMSSNRSIFQSCKKSGKPIVIIEVGNLVRNVTWRISLTHINNLGQFGSSIIDLDRPKKLKVNLHPEKNKRKDEVLIACQHEKSLQWEGMPKMVDWVRQTAKDIAHYTDRKIVVRPHPRNLFSISEKNVTFEIPKKLAGTYDDFDIDYTYHCVINHNSGPAVQAAIHGVPIICDRTSLAFSVSDSINNIEHAKLPDRNEWFLNLCHKEWLVEEIKEGTPFERLRPYF